MFNFRAEMPYHDSVPCLLCNIKRYMEKVRRKSVAAEDGFENTDFTDNGFKIKIL